MNKSTALVTDSSFEQEVIQSTRPTLVYFWAEWCGECQPMSQTVDAVAAEKIARVKTLLLNVDENPLMAALHCIAMVPTVILFISGRERQRIEGLTNKPHLSSTIEMHISRDSDEEIEDQTFVN